MKLFICSLLALGFTTQALAARQQIRLSTAKKDKSAWTLSEVIKGKIVTGKPVYTCEEMKRKGECITYGGIHAFTFPWTNNDGYWYADTYFTLPAGATHVVLHIYKLGVDDRVVVEINKHIVVGAGTNSGQGQMLFTDPGKLKNFDFCCVSGRQDIVYDRKKSFVIGGQNDLRLIVNNTNDGIYGNITPNGPTNVGMKAIVTYIAPDGGKTVSHDLQ